MHENVLVLMHNINVQSILEAYFKQCIMTHTHTHSLEASLNGSGVFLRFCLNSTCPSSSTAVITLSTRNLTNTLLVEHNSFTRYCWRNTRVGVDSKLISGGELLRKLQMEPVPSLPRTYTTLLHTSRHCSRSIH